MSNEASLRAALTAVRDRIEQPVHGGVTDTFWMTPTETVVDYINTVLDAEQRTTAHPTDAEITRARDELLLSLSLATLATMPQDNLGQHAAFDNLSQRTEAWLNQMAFRYPQPKNTENL